MKRKLKNTLALVLTIVLMGTLFCSCGIKDNPSTESQNPSDESTGSNLLQDPSDESTDNNQLTSGNADVTEEARPASVWEKYFYVDDFNQETSEWYIMNTNFFTGTFSNSATTDSTLTVRVLIDAECVSIILYEYGRTQVKNTSTRYNEEYTVAIRTENGDTYSFDAFISPSADRIFFSDSDDQKIVNLLKAGDVSIHITLTDRPTTKYLFQVKSENLSQMLSGTRW